MKRVLILSITAGQGHNSTAKAICTELESMGAETKILDTGYFYSKLLGQTIEEGYLLSVENAKSLYRKVYSALEHRKSYARLSPVHLANLMLWKKLRRYIDDYNPDVIVSTHIFPAMILDVMDQMTPLRARTVGIVTDFVFHPYWEDSCRLDYVIVASDLLISLGIRKGYRPEQIVPSGIPINPKFSQKISKEQAASDAGLNPALPVVLVMGGSMGYGHLNRTVADLDSAKSQFQIVVVCGSNKEAKKALDAMTLRHKSLIFGYTDKVDRLMDAADIIVSKPGGLTSSEALAKGLPMLIVNPIPGHEERNAQFLLNMGAAMQINDMFTVDLMVDRLFSDSYRLASMKEAAQRLGKPDATLDLCNLIMASEARSPSDIAAKIEKDKAEKAKKEKSN